jgi:hypothetical protein
MRRLPDTSTSVSSCDRRSRQPVISGLAVGRRRSKTFTLVMSLPRSFASPHHVIGASPGPSFMDIAKGDYCSAAPLENLPSLRSQQRQPFRAERRAQSVAFFTDARPLCNEALGHLSRPRSPEYKWLREAGAFRRPKNLMAIGSQPGFAPAPPLRMSSDRSRTKELPIDPAPLKLGPSSRPLRPFGTQECAPLADAPQRLRRFCANQFFFTRFDRSNPNRS